MSREDLSCAGVCKKRFKGIENFLKRVAFNLGNTPSQTEVKIISCIPIDVTDLQQKIIHLEKQLEDATTALESAAAAENPPEKISKSSRIIKFPKLSKSGCHRAKTESNFYNATTAVPCGSFDSERCSSTQVCLDNTEKSNISLLCHLNTNTSPIDRSTSVEVSSSDISDGQVNQAVKFNKENHYYNKAVKPNKMDRNYNQPIKSNNMNRYYNQAMKFNNMNRWYHQPVNPNNMAHYYNTLPKIREPQPNHQRLNIFRKKKKFLKNKIPISPCVYYAQTYSSPFIKSDLREEVPKHETSDTMTHSYLAAMVSKQYKPEVLGDNVSLQSQFSSPICRDVQAPAGMACEGTCRLESDICSCCHGQFHNLDVDAHGNMQNTFQTYMLHEMNAGSDFYDTNQYDLVPVKEKPVIIKKDLERKKGQRAYIDMKCWPENVRTKYPHHLLNPLPTGNHYAVRPRIDYLRDKLDCYGRKMSDKHNRKEPNTRILAKRRKEMYRKEQSINVETSKSCSIDFGNVYPKRIYKKPKRLDCLQPTPVPKKNAECLTTVINNSECQTEMSTVEVALPDNKTEVTLNQIKSILQSVLAEVKVSSQAKAQVSENKPKKDAVVQKGASRNNMQASSFMNSITYSPYAMNPSPYMTSCSKQMTPSQFYCSHGGMKCFHNFPVFIQTPGGRHMCASCYRSSLAKPASKGQATTTATNTDVVKDEHSQETEKLIKEIYKSMALTMDFPNNTSLSEYDETMKSMHDFTTPKILKNEPKKQPKKFRNVVQAVSELFMRKDMMETSETFNTTIESKLPSHEASARSHTMTTNTDTELSMRKGMLEKYMRAKNKQPVVHEENKTVFRDAMVQDAYSESESEVSSSEPETDTTVVGRGQQVTPELKHVIKKRKEGLLTKMFKSVKMFKRREEMVKEKPKIRVEKSESEEESTSDSDDYQTVYSQKIEKNPIYRNRPHYLPKRKTHSKISYKQTYQRDRSPEKKRSPYMEQEYRKHWDEKLMFENKRPQYSERQYSEQSTPRRPAYYQSYEARSVLVEPNKHIPKNDPKITKEIYNANKSILKPASNGMAWLKKHKIHCGEQWKKLVLES